MKIFKSYGFWTAFAGALTMLLNSLGKCFGFYVNNELVSEVIMSIAGLLVVFGVVSMPKNEKKKEEKKEDEEASEEDNSLENAEKADKKQEKTDISSNLEEKEEEKEEQTDND